MNMTRYARLFYGIAARAVMPAVLALIFAFVPAVTAGYAAPAEVPPPRCDSPSCVVMDAVSGEVLFEKNSREKRHPASVTKIMTLLLTLEDVAAGKVALSDQVTASANAWEMGGTEVWAEPGETMELEEWIKAVAVASANDGAVILAEYISGTEEAFVARMNERARELGMVDTTFQNSHGLDADNHVTTAMDLAILSRAATQVPHLLDYTKIYQMPFRGGKNELVNFNKLVLLYPGCDGLKTGFTNKSGYCISVTAHEKGSRFIVVLMGAETPDQRLADASRLLDWAFANFRSLPILDPGEVVAQARVLKGKADTVTVIPERPFAVTLRRGQKGEVKQYVDVQKVVAPVVEGAAVGAITVHVDGEKVAQIPLIAKESVERAGFLDYAMRYFRAFTVGR
ncbi:MAG: D-alanyl-D-alanine carboxypeptidase family protein [Bacillota bacterium]|jgi:D-alanyl-D-alanine carboxypeptidase (penicillin-binding protein 5/6)|nr:D-alanyl-D-alanine carboxypeptidase [Candidatus Fermentithermobacillaceae bacterium]